ncbi:MAG TPA: alpha/beta fold hydrolase [Fibrobacteria bacterium]|nr:alpha/beta fold hydrolase [Fibrobacteria bacterium]
MDHSNPFVAALVASALASAAQAQTTVTLNFGVNGTTRNAVVHVPSGVNKPPVVYFVHGYGGTGASFESDTKGDAVADTAKFIAVYPSAIGGSWSMYDTTDYPFLLALLDTVDARYKIDRNRVYCAGFSQGGFISFGVGYKHPGTFAAVAPVSGHIPSFSTAAPLKRPVPLFLTFGTNDVSDVASFMTDVNTWMGLDTCVASSKKEVRPYPASNKNSVVARITYSCAQGSELMIDSVVGGPHEWAMDVTTKVNTTVEVWNFFKGYTLAGTTSLQPLPASMSTMPLSATFRAGRIELRGAGDARTVRVEDLRGELVARASLVDRSFEFANKPRGTYLIEATGISGTRTFKVTIP